jgi:hypothetical protein
MKSNAKNSTHEYSYLAAALTVLAVIFILGCSKQTAETTAGSPQTTFSTPAEAGQALQAAAHANDDHALERILGPEAKALISSGDPVEDKAAMDSFAAKYERMNRWVTMTDGSRVLYIGADNYPYPIPLAKDASSKWYFNSAAGKDEILARRIGRNELLAIDACSSMANAEELYYQKARDGNSPHRYADTILSTPGKQDGLYWDVPEGQILSPLGKLSDFAKGTISSGAPNKAPIFDGYSIRILTSQGEASKGGAKNYLVNGKMTGGFAILASPVTYQDSGIMTFLLNREGVVYQKDLGPQTAAAAASIQEYNPNEGWVPAE